MYQIWKGIKQRCNNPKNSAYKNYGGRGIKLCERWNLFTLFVEDMGMRPDKKSSIDRIDNNKGYYKENCKWSTRSDQNRNKRNQRRSGFKYVYIDNRSQVNPFTAQIKIEGKSYNLGSFKTEKEAQNEFVKIHKEWFGFLPSLE